MAIQAFEKRAWKSLVGRTVEVKGDAPFNARRLYIAEFDADLGFTLVNADDHDEYIYCARRGAAQIAYTGGNVNWWMRSYKSLADAEQGADTVMRVMAHMIRCGIYEDYKDVYASSKHRIPAMKGQYNNDPGVTACAFAM